MSTMVESEMKEFFQRVIDSVAELSSQAARVEGLVQQVQELTSRVNQFELDNRTLYVSRSTRLTTRCRRLRVSLLLPRAIWIKKRQ